MKISYIKFCDLRSLKALSFLMISILSFSSYAQKVDSKKPRIVITCDPELDDNNSLIRFLLYSTDFNIEGLVYASSQFHWKGDGKGTKWFVEGREYTRFGLNMDPMESWRWSEDERFIHDAVEAYEKVYPNLKIHNSAYPTPDYLKSKIKWGNIEFDGDYSKDTEGSELIKSLILDDKPGPLFLAAWGGASTITRALKSIEDQYGSSTQWNAIKEKIEAKVILCLSGDQDNTYENYIKPHFSGIDILATTFGNVPLGYNAQNRVSESNQVYYSPQWTKENILDQGPLGSLYRVWGDGKQMVKGDIFDFFGFSGISEEELRAKGYVVWTPLKEKNAFLGEGDTHTFLNLIDNGLRAHENQYYGGWAGKKSKDANLESTLSISGEQESLVNGLSFIPAVQNGIAARFKWSVTNDYNLANHEPIIEGPLEIIAHAGESVQLHVSVNDPDGDAVELKWVQFENEDYSGSVTIENSTSTNPKVRIPLDVKAGQNIHLVLEVLDNGAIPLTKYHRTILKIVE